MRKILLSAFVFVAVVAISQNKKGSTPDYSKMPYWIEMIKNPNVNYFEATKAYEAFWKGKKKPTEEDEVIGQEKQATEKQSKKRQKEILKEKELYRKYALECKKFEHWKRSMKPYVQADGRILSKEEQLKMWEEQKSKRN